MGTRATWDLTQRVARDSAGPVRSAFTRGSQHLLTALDRVAQTVDAPSGFARVVQARGPWEAFERELLTGFRAALVPVFGAGYRSALRDARRKAPPARPTPVELQLGVAWMDAYGARLVREIAQDTQRGIQDAVNEGLARGEAPREIARELRDFVGLTSREARAVTNRRRLLEGQERKPAQVDRMAAAYRDRLVSLRATRIARTEVMSARNEGVLQGWQRLVSEGGLPATGMGKMWIAALEIACPICAPLHKEVVPINGTFSNGRARPPMHVHCRCTMGLVDLADAEA